MAEKIGLDEIRRQAGEEKLRREMVGRPTYQQASSMGPLMSLLFGGGMYNKSLPERMREQREGMQADYYAVPPPPAESVKKRTPEQLAYENLEPKEHPESASGKAIPTITDQDALNMVGGRLMTLMFPNMVARGPMGQRVEYPTFLSREALKTDIPQQKIEQEPEQPAMEDMVPSPGKKEKGFNYPTAKVEPNPGQYPMGMVPPAPWWFRPLEGYPRIPESITPFNFGPEGGGTRG